MKTSALPRMPAICLILLAFLINVKLTTSAVAQGADPFGGDLDDLFGAPAAADPFGGGGSAADDDPFGESTAKPVKGDDAKQSAEDGDEPESAEGEDVAGDDEPQPPPIDPALMRIFLSNGNILTGKLSTHEFTVTTAFGQLRVPVTRVNSLTPGLKTHAEVYRNLQKLIDELGVDDYRAREEAQKALAGWGLPIRGVLLPYRDDANAERARRVKEILAQMEEAAADLDETEEDVDEWIEGDTVVTDRFTVVGGVAPQQITVASKYGELTVPLADVKEIRRLAAQDKTSVARSIVVSGEYLAQKKYKNSGIRLEKGDRIVVSAQGRITRGGSSSYWSGPDGSERFGSYSEEPPIPGGALVAKIGKAGDVLLIGSSSRFLASQAGMLHFAIAMRSEDAGRYQYPGQYNIKIRVVPK